MKYIFIQLLVFSLIISCNSKKNRNSNVEPLSYEDGLDQIGNSNSQNNRMKDVYRAYFVRNISNEIDNYVYNQFIINPKYEILTLQDGRRKKNYYVQYQEQMIQLQKNKLILVQGIKFNDKKLQYLSDLCIKRMYNLLNQMKPNKKMYYNGTYFSRLMHDFNFRIAKFQRYISQYYDIKTFTDLKEDEFWKLNDKKNYIKDIRYETYKKLIMNNKFDQAILLLKKIIVETKDFQEQTIYKIQLADQLVSFDLKKHSITHYNEALGIYNSILESKKYSIYLFETWVKWRSLQQANVGFSNKDKVDNRLHENTRLEILKTIFTYLQKHPNDPMAINYYLTVSSHPCLFQFESKETNTEDFLYYFNDVSV